MQEGTGLAYRGVLPVPAQPRASGCPETRGMCIRTGFLAAWVSRNYRVLGQQKHLLRKGHWICDGRRLQRPALCGLSAPPS